MPQQMNLNAAALAASVQRVQTSTPDAMPTN